MNISSNIMPIFPEIFLILSALGFLLVGVFQGNKATDVICWSACASFIIAIFLILNADLPSTVLTLNKMLVVDDFAKVSRVIILFGLLLSMALSVRYIYQERISRFEYPVLMLMAGIGMMFMVCANNLLSLYMALELQSLSLYILAAFHRNSAKSSEAASKYFILGALSSGMLLFGISLIYGYTGSLDFTVINEALSAEKLIPPGFTIGMVFIITAMAFKISAVPFHMWTPDVYQGAPTSVTAFFAIVPKVAALAVFIRLLYIPFDAAVEQWTQILYLISIGSLIVGSFAAIAQDNIKRIIAYSSIGNMGYALIGVIASSPQGVESVLIFITIYMIMTAGTFAVVMCMRRNDIAVENISDLSGLSKNQPILAYSMAALMFSMSGIPPLAGFIGKLYIFNAAIASGHYMLAIFGVIASVVAAFYYLRIIKVMFFDEPADVFDSGFGIERRLVLLFSLIFILSYILAPNFLLEGATLASTSLF